MSDVLFEKVKNMMYIRVEVMREDRNTSVSFTINLQAYTWHQFMF